MSMCPHVPWSFHRHLDKMADGMTFNKMLQTSFSLKVGFMKEIQTKTYLKVDTVIPKTISKRNKKSKLFAFHLYEKYQKITRLDFLKTLGL
jgi:hypothetical protein